MNSTNHTELAATEATPEPTCVRVGCGYCFETLDSTVHDNAGPPVRCCGCGQHFHEAHYQSTCPMPGCDSSHAKPVALPPPATASPLRLKAVIASGPQNSIEDVPVGIDTGTLEVGNHGPQTVLIRNNTDEAIELEPPGSPLWTTAGYSGELRYLAVPRLVVDNLKLAAHATASLVVRGHLVRPGFRRGQVSVYGNHGFDVMSRQSAPIRFVWVFVLAAIALTHWELSRQGMNLLRQQPELARESLWTLGGSMPVPEDAYVGLWPGLSFAALLTWCAGAVLSRLRMVLCRLAGVGHQTDQTWADMLIPSVDQPTLQDRLVDMSLLGTLALFSVCMWNVTAWVLSQIFGDGALLWTAVWLAYTALLPTLLFAMLSGLQIVSPESLASVVKLQADRVWLGGKGSQGHRAGRKQKH